MSLKSILILILIFLIYFVDSHPSFSSNNLQINNNFNQSPSQPQSQSQSQNQNQPQSQNQSQNQNQPQNQSQAGDGISPSRRSISSLLFTIPCLLISLILLCLGPSLNQLLACLGFGIGFGLISWSLIINLIHSGGLTSQSTSNLNQNLAIWALVFSLALSSIGICFFLGNLGKKLGLILISLESGLALGISILLFDNQLVIKIKLITLDLLINENRGISLGLRFFFDQNHLHHQELLNFNPPNSTKILLSFNLFFGFLIGWFQYWLLYYRPLKNIQSLHNHQHLIQNSLVDEKITKQTDQLSNCSLTHDLHSPLSPQSQIADTSGSYDTGLSVIPELTEERSRSQSTNETSPGINKSKTDSSRLTNLFHSQSHRHPSNSTCNSIRQSSLSSEYHLNHNNNNNNNNLLSSSTITTIDPSNIPVSPPTTLLTETTIFPEDSISQNTRQRIHLPFRHYHHSEYIQDQSHTIKNLTHQGNTINQLNSLNHHDSDKMEELIKPQFQSSYQSPDLEINDFDQHLDRVSLIATSSSYQGLTGALARIARVFGDENTSPFDQNEEQVPLDSNFDEQTRENETLECDAARWASLADPQSPYQHTANFRRDLHSWTEDQ
ncbi:hypothetical protein O181_048911 [Austropuccinia psidii MF-1]|uniref:DUF4203 domain-containing protein n=1 Tax=Austropuccinia psidii MF-1 TaxID=1389203 RepID=A0A9Q3DYW2_9BASI|nr:hypothetical protein [Austropuccinia psidii MF-1]